MKDAFADDRHVAAFLECVEPALAAYRYTTASFVTLVHDGAEILLNGSIRLTTSAPAPLAQNMLTKRVRAAEVDLSPSGLGLRDIVRLVTTGPGVLAGNHLLRLPRTERADYSTYYDCTEPSRWKRGRFRLVVSGEDQCMFINAAVGVEKELRGRGFASFHDLFREYGLSGNHACQLEITADGLPLLGRESTITQSTMTLIVHLPSSLSAEEVRVSVRSAHRDERGTQRLLDPSAFVWTCEGDGSTGRHRGPARSGDALICQALYKGAPHDALQLADPTTVINLKRAVVEVHDPELRGLKKALTGVTARKEKGRNEFESSVGVLFYMLGFESVRIGSVRKLSDGPDIYALAPQRDALVVECTTGAFNKDKLEKLLVRANEVREALHRVTDGTTQVFPVIVCPLKAQEAWTLAKLTDRQGVILVALAEIEEALERTRFTPDPARTLDAWRGLSMRRYLSAPPADE